MASNKRTNRFNGGKRQEAEIVSRIDDLMEFEKFKEEILPILRKAVREGWTPEKIYSRGMSMLAAKTLSNALTEKDPAKALALTKEIMDRTMGKSKETVNVTTRMEKLSDEELDAVLASEEAALRDASDHDASH